MNFMKNKERQLLKDKKYSSTNEIWNKYHFNSRKNVGCTNELIKKLYANKTDTDIENITVEDFENFYYINGKSKKEIILLSKKFKEKCLEYNIELTDDEALNYIIIRVIDDTYNGFKKEIDALKKLQEWYPGFIVKFSDYNDVNYAIDIEVWTEYAIVECYQVKPISFFKGIIYKKQYILEALEYNHKKHDAFYKRYDANTYFYINDEIYTYEKLVSYSKEAILC